MLNFKCEDCVKQLWNEICYEIIDSRLTDKIKVPYLCFQGHSNGINSKVQASSIPPPVSKTCALS